MFYPDDRVLVGVIKRKRDLDYLLKERWYRIPQEEMPRGIYAEYLAFFLNTSVAKPYPSGIHYYAKRRGVELVRRRDLLPLEVDNPRQDQVYYKVVVDEAIRRVPPITNPTRRSIGFILTTWDRLSKAQTIADLYSKADYFVDRIYHALRDARIRPERYWELERRETQLPPQVRILCENGVVIASTEPVEGVSVLLDGNLSDDAILAQIQRQIAQQGGTVTLNIPID